MAWLLPIFLFLLKLTRRGLMGLFILFAFCSAPTAFAQTTSPGPRGGFPPILTTCSNDAACNDGLFCTGVERCVRGQCIPAAEPPDPRLGQSCRNGDEDCSSPGAWTCNEDADRIECNSVLRPDGFSCSDGNACNGDETCQSGSCVAGDPLAVEDGDLCTEDSCDSQTGEVRHEPIDVDDGIACTIDRCRSFGQARNISHTPDNSLCDDGNACTTDICDAASGCQNHPIAGCGEEPTTTPTPTPVTPPTSTPTAEPTPTPTELPTTPPPSTPVTVPTPTPVTPPTAVPVPTTPPTSTPTTPPTPVTPPVTPPPPPVVVPTTIPTPTTPPTPVTPPVPVALCGNGVLDEGEACDEGTANDDARVGACQIDCQGWVHPACRADIPTPPPFQSETFDGELNCTAWAPMHTVTAVAKLNENYETQQILFAGHTDDQALLGYKRAVEMSPDCNFSYDSCRLEGAPWQFLQAARLNGEALNDVVAVRDNQYVHLFDVDAALAAQAEDDCRLTPLLLSAELDGTRQVSGVTGRLVRIHDLEILSFPNDLNPYIGGAVELDVDAPDPGKAIAVDLFRYNLGRIDHNVIPVYALPADVEVEELRLAASDSSTAAFDIIVTTNLASRLITCQREEAAWICGDPVVLAEAPLILVDAAAIMERIPDLTEEERERTRGEERARVMVGREGHVYEIEAREETEVVADERERLDGDERDDERERGRERAEERRRVRHAVQEVGRVTAEGFNPRGRAQAVDGWFEVQSHNFVVTEEAALRLHRIRFDEATETLAVERLENEILTADSPLAFMFSNETIRYTHPTHPISFLRNNFGGIDLFSCFDAVDACSGETQGTVCTVFHNHNEPPILEAEQEEAAPQRVTLRLFPEDPTRDDLTCTAELRDAAGNDLSAWIVQIDCEKVVINLQGLSEGAPAIGLSIVGTAQAQTPGGPLTLTVTTTDPGNLSASKAATIDPVTGHIIGDIRDAGPTGVVEGVIKGFKSGVRGGGLFCHLNPNTPPANNSVWIWLALPLVILFLLRQLTVRARH